MGRPVLIDKSFLKPKIIVDPIVIDIPSISFNYFKPEMDNQSISILVNLAFFTILTFGALWIYHLYLDKLDTKIDKLADAIVAIARIEERVTTVLKQNDRFIMRMDRLENRVETVEQKAIVNSKGINMFERLFWIGVSAIASIIVYNLR